MNNSSVKKVLLALVSVVVLVCALILTVVASQPAITYDDGKLTVENSNVIYSVGSKGSVESFIYKADNKNYLKSNSYLAYLVSDGVRENPKAMTANAIAGKSNAYDVTLSFTDFDLYLTVEAYDEYIIMRINNEIPDTCEYVVFGDLRLDSSVLSSDLAVFDVSLNVNTQMMTYPSQYRKLNTYMGKAYSHLGTTGAKIAMVTSSNDDYYSVLRYINANVANVNETIVSTMGGPYAQTGAVVDASVNDYVILTSKPTDSELRNYLDYDVKQFDMHQSAGTFIQGSMSFNNSSYGGTVEGFRKNVTNHIKQIAEDEYGYDDIRVGLHTYAYYISTADTDLISNPSTLRQLEYFEDEIYTLKNTIGQSNTSFSVYENNRDFNFKTEFFSYNSRYLLVDNEIMYVSSVGNGNTFNVTRGCLGTTAASHSAASSVYHLTGLFNMLVPKMDSQLFIDIAHNTAEAYVKGGFEMIYIDAIDGLDRHTEDIWYYFGLFVKEIFAEIDRYRNMPEYSSIDIPDPIVEYSSMATSAWAARTRDGAYDTASRGHKDFIRKHTVNNASNPYNYTTTIGWYNLYEVPLNSSGSENLNIEIQTPDVMDYLGKNIIAYNMGMSYNGFNSVKTIPAMKRNADILNEYIDLRNEGYFTDAVKNAIKDTEKEFKLVYDSSAGVWGFEEVGYDVSVVYDTQYTYSASNGFAAQKPMLIRVQALASSDSSASETILDFDEAKAVTEYFTNAKYSYTPASPINLSALRALRLKIYGNNASGKVNVIMEDDDGTIWSRTVETNFTGWRTITLAELGNGVGDNEFTSAYSLYGIYRTSSDNNIVKVTLQYSGNCNGVRLDTVEAVPAKTNTITNPTVSYNGSTVRFATSVKSPEYVEYDGNVAVKYDEYGNITNVAVTKTGSGIAPAGAFTYTLGVESSTYAPRARVTFGFSGNVIYNDLTGEAPASIEIKKEPVKTTYAIGEAINGTGLELYLVNNTGRKSVVTSGYTVDTTAKATAGRHNVTVTYQGLTTTYAVTVEPVVTTSVAVNHAPTKTTYYVGDTVNPSGLSITVSKSDGTSTVISTGFSVESVNLDEAGITRVHVYYDGKETYFDVTVRAVSVEKIRLVKAPLKTAYYAGELFNTTGMIIYADYNSGESVAIDTYSYSPAGALKTSDTEITITYGGYSVTQPITVALPVTGTSFEFTANDVYASSNSDVTVTLRLDNVATGNGMESVELKLYYDSALTYKSASITNIDGWSLWNAVSGTDTNGSFIRLSAVDESEVANPVDSGDLAFKVVFATQDGVANGTAYSLRATEACGSDSMLRFVEGEGTEFTVTISNRINLAAYSQYEIDRADGYVFINDTFLTEEDFKANFSNNVTVEKSTTYVTTDSVVKLAAGDDVVEQLTVILIGDVNKNGRLDTNDYTLIKRHYTNVQSLSGAQLVAADANRNSMIDTSDYLMVKKHYVGEIDILIR